MPLNDNNLLQSKGCEKCQLFKWKKGPVLERPRDSGLFSKVLCRRCCSCVCWQRRIKTHRKIPWGQFSTANRLRITMKYFLGPVTVKPTQGDLSRNALQRHNAFYCQGEKKGGRKKVIEVWSESKSILDIFKTNQVHMPHLECLWVNTMPFKHGDALPPMASSVPFSTALIALAKTTKVTPVQKGRKTFWRVWYLRLHLLIILLQRNVSKK